MQEDRIPPVKRHYRAALYRRLDEQCKVKREIHMERGNPCSEQLAFSDAMFNIKAKYAADGTDCRNYSGPDLLLGLPEIRKLAASYLGTLPRETAVIGHASLTLIHDVLALSIGKNGRDGWRGLDIKPKIICPVPGYDRHFGEIKKFGIEMIPVPMKSDGPDMSIVRTLVQDKSVIGIICVPKNSNPGGETYSVEVATELATMKTACPGFLILWDNAYAWHDLVQKPPKVPNIMRIARNHRTQDRIAIFGSFSKVTRAGSALAFLAMSEKNLAWFKADLQLRMITSDKITQLHHARFLRNLSGVKMHMRKHARILQPKFAAVDEELTKHFKHRAYLVKDWTRPTGGYFVSIFFAKRCAKRIVELCKKMGLILTAAGSAYPPPFYDPDDSHIRLSVTYLPISELREAIAIIALAAEIAYRENHTW